MIWYTAQAIAPDDMFSFKKKPEVMYTLCCQNWLYYVLLKNLIIPGSS